jgi:hypothetical protein
LLAEICLMRFRKIPFACSYLPGKTPVHMVILCAIALMYLAILSARYEKEALLGSRSIEAMLVLFALAVLGSRLVSVLAGSDDEELDFEEALPPVVMELGLHRDGVMPVGAPDQAR